MWRPCLKLRETSPLETPDPNPPRNGGGTSPREIFEEVAGDDFALDLGGAFVDPWGPHRAVEVLQEMAFLEGLRPVDLDGGVQGRLGHTHHRSSHTRPKEIEDAHGKLEALIGLT